MRLEDLRCENPIASVWSVPVAASRWGLLLYALSNAGYIATQVTPTNLWQIAGVSLVILFLSFATPQRAQS